MSAEHKHDMLPLETAFSTKQYDVGYFVVRWACAVDGCGYEETQVLEASEV